MRVSMLAARALLPVLLLLMAAPAHADTGVTPDAALAPDAGYAMPKDVVGAGGMHSSGGGYGLNATGGQPAVGLVSGTGFSLHAGFWSACLAEAPVAPVPSVQLAGLEAADVALDWPAVALDAAYQVWVSEDPYLDPDSAAGVTPTVTDQTSFTDPGVAASLTNHFYVLRGLNRCGAPSGNSGRLGEFTYGLTPGS